MATQARRFRLVPIQVSLIPAGNTMQGEAPRWAARPRLRSAVRGMDGVVVGTG